MSKTLSPFDTPNRAQAREANRAALQADLASFTTLTAQPQAPGTTPTPAEQPAVAQSPAPQPGAAPVAPAPAMPAGLPDQLIADVRRIDVQVSNLFDRFGHLAEGLKDLAAPGFTMPKGIDAELQRDTPWLFEVLTDLCKQLDSMAQAQAKIVSALGGHAVSVKDYWAGETAAQETQMAKDLDRMFGARWRNLLDAAHEDNLKLNAWMRTLPFEVYQTSSEALAHAKHAYQLEPVLREFYKHLDAQAPPPNAPSTAPASTESQPFVASAAAPAPAPADQLQPLDFKDLEPNRWAALLRQCKTPEEAELLRKRAALTQKMALTQTYIPSVPQP